MLENTTVTLTQKQREAIKKFRAKARNQGWRYVEKEKNETNGVVIVTMLDPRNRKHWLKVSPDGEMVFMPVKIPGVSL